MATIQATFDQVSSGIGSVPKELWIDLGVIPSGKQIWFGYASLVAPDKDVQFELRSNTAGLSAGTTAATQLHDFASAQSGSSVDRDLYRGGNIATMSVVGTGVEHWWIRGQSNSQTVGALNYIFYYAIY